MFDALVEAEKALVNVSLVVRRLLCSRMDWIIRATVLTDDVITAIGPSGLTISTIGFGNSSTASQYGLDET